MNTKESNTKTSSMEAVVQPVLQDTAAYFEKTSNRN